MDESISKLLGNMTNDAAAHFVEAAGNAMTELQAQVPVSGQALDGFNKAVRRIVEEICSVEQQKH